MFLSSNPLSNFHPYLFLSFSAGSAFQNKNLGTLESLSSPYIVVLKRSFASRATHALIPLTYFTLSRATREHAFPLSPTKILEQVYYSYSSYCGSLYWRPPANRGVMWCIAVLCIALSCPTFLSTSRFKLMTKLRTGNSCSYLDILWAERNFVTLGKEKEKNKFQCCLIITELLENVHENFADVIT